MTYEANKILKTDELSEGKKLKLQENMLKMTNLMESKILTVEMEIENFDSKSRETRVEVHISISAHPADE